MSPQSRYDRAQGVPLVSGEFPNGQIGKIPGPGMEPGYIGWEDEQWPGMTYLLQGFTQSLGKKRV
jgi:hypothetical protein